MITSKAVEGPLNAQQLSPTGGLAFMLCFFSGLAFPKLSLSTLVSRAVQKTLLCFSEHSWHLMECDNLIQGKYSKFRSEFNTAVT